MNRQQISGITYRVNSTTDTNLRDQERVSVPILLEAKQLDTNKIELIFDRPVDLKSATNISHYWLQSNEQIPTGVASLGINEEPNLTNSLKPKFAWVQSFNFTKTILVLIFKRRLTTCVQYRVLPWFINTDGKYGYNGPNYSDLSKNTFIAR
ncbi:hypothetical protein J5Y03_05565 [Bacillus sp. RG28]|uniref:Uncharacterized protein n=1 Tax=Gottfriedia endophytica TaxID=2820819 RepID=A0A940SJ91_9BACI|nr:hypothetical protein [Gottfriedia endophytica]MBP0724654.1 hypothetical protein [Gottfriedia endophytica]